MACLGKDGRHPDSWELDGCYFEALAKMFNFHCKTHEWTHILVHRVNSIINGHCIEMSTYDLIKLLNL